MSDRRRIGLDFEPDEPSQQDLEVTGTRDEIDLLSLFNVLWRRKYRLLTIVGVVTAAAIFYTLRITPTYTAGAEIMVDTRGTKIVEIEQVIPTLAADGSLIQTQTEILRSPSLMKEVVDRLSLSQDPEFNPALRPNTDILPKWLQPKRLLKSLLGPAKPAPRQAGEGAPTQVDLTLPIARSRLGVRAVGQSYIIEVSFNSNDPVKAARIANTVTELYLERQVKTKIQATRQANAWLEERLKQLQAAVITAEREVETFREKAGLIVSNGVPISQQQLAEVNSRLIIAQAERASGEARFRQLEALMNGSGALETAPEVLNSTLINSLRQQESLLMRKVSEMSNRYRPGHPAMIAAQDELRNLQESIAAEVKKVIGGVATQLAIARNRETDLLARLEELREEAARNNQAETQLRALEREAEASKTLYTTFLNRFKETREQEGLFQPDAQIVTRAQPPLRPSHPKKSLLVGGAFMGSLALVSLFMLIANVFDGTFRTTSQVRSETGLRVLGMVPSIPQLTSVPGLHFVSEHLDRLLGLVRIGFYTCIAVVVVLSLYPKMEMDSGLDKIYHVIAYFGLGVAALVAFKERRSSLIATAMLLPLAGGLELAQELVPGRNGSLLDFAADLAGIAIGLFVGLSLRNRFLGNLLEDAAEPGFEFQEAIRRVCTGISQSKHGGPPKVVLVTSALPDEGKSMLSASLAQFFGRSNRRCLLIDSDVRRPSLYAILNLPPTPGLAEILNGEGSLDDIVQKTGIGNLDFLPAGDNGQSGPDPAGNTLALDHLLSMLGSDTMADLIEEAKTKYDLVIIDSPAVTVVSEPRLLTRLVDKTVFATRWGKTKRSVALAGLNEILGSGGDVAGVVLTRVDRKKLRLYESPESAFLYTSYLGYGAKSYITPSR